MKLKNKILNSILTLSTTVPTVLTAASCSKFTKYDAIAEVLKQDTINEFIELSKNYRDTYHTKAIALYLEEWANTNGFTPVNNKDTYKPDKIFDDNGWEVMFDVPASKDGEKIPPIILQAHSDMVLKGNISKVKERGVKVVEENGFLHSENWESSLGADNGVGMALMLALAENKDKFTHGILRMIFTTDEENGNSGAVQTPQDWLILEKNGEKQPIEYFINCDSEDYDQMSTTCGGCIQGKWTRTFSLDSAEPLFKLEEIPTIAKQYEIKISGLLGGHSALEIDQGRINAIKLFCKMIRQMNNEFVDKPVSLACFFEGDSSESEVSIGTIPSQITAVITTETAKESIQKIIDEIKERAIIDHPTEKDLTVTFEDITEERMTFTHQMPQQTVTKLMNFVYEIPYGVIQYDKKFGVDASANIAGFRFLPSKTLPYTYFLNVDVMARSYVWKKIRFICDEIFSAILSKYFEGEKFVGTGQNVPWVAPDDDKVQKIFLEAASKIKVPLRAESQSWWLEAAAFFDIAEKLGYTLNAASVGVTVYDPHTVNEKIQINTIAPFTKMLLYALEYMK